MAAKFPTSATFAVLFCLFALSIARTTPENDDSTAVVPLTYSEIVTLPVTTETESKSVAELASALPATTETESKPVAESSSTLPANTETETLSVNVVDLTAATFRPINRHFRSKRRPCGHHHLKFDPAMREKLEEIPYGNDMIVASGENSDFDGVEKIRVKRWFHHHHHHHHHDEDSDSDSDSEDSDDEDDDKVFGRIYKSLDGKKALKKLRKHFRHHQKEEEEKEKGGFMNRVRQFFNQYF